MKKALIAIGMFTMSGCALLNPYESSFSCPESSKGKCVSVQTAYSESATGSGKRTEISADHKDENCSPDDASAGTCNDGEKGVKHTAGSKEGSTYNHYRTALFDKFSGLLKEPVTPVVAPPKTMRVLLLPYTGQDNEFYMLRYVYFFVDEPRWLLGDSVSSGEEE
ncbi:MAG: type IV conjugative transfer system protein TraV [Deltaproteobacteria bacterium HGW-Deltaproteobacteria-23]|nr:MAG: type IV conjugative transfer system protein TraV [Deltaproteobacteria bacterium HGW-Deltaproteobacteria-23]